MMVGARPTAGPALMVSDRYGRGPPVVLLHGQPGSAGDWRAVAPLLWDDFTVVVPDRLGYGRTGGVAAGFEQNASAVAALLDSLGYERALVAGHSWAGAVALTFAMAFPERAAGLVLAASVGPGERFGWDDRLLAAPLLGDLLAALTIGAAGRVLGTGWAHHLVDRHLGDRARQAVNALAGSTGAGTGAAAWRSFVVEQRVLLRDLDSVGARLPSVTTPTLILNGSADHVVPPVVADRLAAAIPGAIHVVVAGARHRLPRERPATLAAAVRQIAARAWPPDTRDAGSCSGRSDGQKPAHGEG
jgi:pimeloyl-ACP methyl ester carboxylesterase